MRTATTPGLSGPFGIFWNRRIRSGRATELYWDTAGEIEARNVAGRRNLTTAERKNTPPNLGDEDTVFAENPVRSEQAIGRTTDNKAFVTVERDILQGVPPVAWVKTVTNNLRNKFPNGVTVAKNSIAINQQSRRELTYSEYMHKLQKSDPQIYADKMRSTDNVDEIIKATTDWINEGLKHGRKDDIRDFARGNVLLRIGGNDYTAEVVVGTKASGTMLLYDILNLTPTQFTEKRTDANLTSEYRSGTADRQFASAENIVTEEPNDVKQYSISGTGEENTEHTAEKKTAQQIREEMPAKARNHLTGAEFIKGHGNEVTPKS